MEKQKMSRKITFQLQLLVCMLCISTFSFAVENNLNSNDKEMEKREKEIQNLTKLLKQFTSKKRTGIKIKYITSDSKNPKDAAYLHHFKSKVEIVGNKLYPKEAIIKNLAGSVLIVTAINKDGEVLRIRIDASSGHRILDEAAKNFIRRASPFRKVPLNVIKDKQEINIIYRFKFHTETIK